MILLVIIWLLFVSLFFLLLHLYAKKFLPQLDDETNQTPGIILTGARVARLRGRGSAASNDMINLSKGLESCVISTIPQFVFQEDQKQEEGQPRHGSECVICLSSFENGQVGRRLPSCNHAFHVECIDMWLHSHTTCPICRASAAQESGQKPSNSGEMSGEVSSRLEVIVVPGVEHQ